MTRRRSDAAKFRKNTGSAVVQCRQAGRPIITAVGDGTEGHEDGEMNAAAQQTDRATGRVRWRESFDPEARGGGGKRSFEKLKL